MTIRLAYCTAAVLWGGPSVAKLNHYHLSAADFAHPKDIFELMAYTVPRDRRKIEQRPAGPKDIDDWAKATDIEIWWYGKCYGKRT